MESSGRSDLREGEEVDEPDLRPAGCWFWKERAERKLGCSEQSDLFGGSGVGAKKKQLDLFGTVAAFGFLTLAAFGDEHPN